MLLLKVIFLHFTWWVTALRNERGEGTDVLQSAIQERGGCIDVNRATTQKLTRAKGIGMSLAYRIVRARTCLLKDFDDLRNKLQAQQHPEGLWTFDRTVAPLFHSDPPSLCVNCELDPERAKSPWKQKIIDVNVASFERLQRPNGVGKGMAYRILMARSCFFTSYPSFEERFRATPANSNLWKFVQDAIDAGEICIPGAPSTDSPAIDADPEEENDKEEEKETKDVELTAPESREQEVQASIVVHNVGIQASLPETREFGVQTDMRQTHEIGTQTEPMTREVQTQTEAVEQDVQKIVTANVGDDFLPSQVTCGLGTQGSDMDIEMDSNGPIEQINVVNIINIKVNVAFADQVLAVQQALQSQHFAQQVQWMLQASPAIYKRGQVSAVPTNVYSQPVFEDPNNMQIKNDFWTLMGICGTNRNDFVGYENRPDWEVLPFTNKICRASGCREAMTQFARTYSSPCGLMDATCKEAHLWVSMLFFGSADCGDLLMAEKMHKDLQGPLTACSPSAGGFCTVRCVHALRDFRLVRGCRSAGCTEAYATLEGMYNAISNCPQPNVGNAFPIDVQANGLFLVGLNNVCVLAPVSGGWIQQTQSLYCSYFRPVSVPSRGFGKLVDPRTNLCFGWLHREGQPLTWEISGIQGGALAPCNIQSPDTPDGFAQGYSFHTIWKTQGQQICVMLNSGQDTTFCLNTQSGPDAIPKDLLRTDISQVSDVSKMGQVSDVSKMGQVSDFSKMGQVSDFSKMGQVSDFSKKGDKMVLRGWIFPLPPARYSNLFRLEHGDQCLVTPPNNGWGMISDDLDICTYFMSVSISGLSDQLYAKFKDPRSGLCVGWIHQDGFPGALTIPGANGLAAGPCGDSPGDRIGQGMDFNTVFQNVQDQGQVCIVTNSQELTPYCFRHINPSS